MKGGEHYNLCVCTCIFFTIIVVTYIYMYCSFHKDMVPDSDSSLSGHYNPVPHCMAGNDYIYQH